jgi:hypothetical protein
MVRGSYGSVPNLGPLCLICVRQLEPCLLGYGYLQGLKKAIVNYPFQFGNRS